MNKITLEEQDALKPVFLLYGNNNPLIPLFFIKHPNFSFLFVSENSSQLVNDSPHVRFLKTDSAFLVSHLANKIDYAVLFFKHPSEKNILLHILKKLEKDKTKTVIVVSVASLRALYSVIREIRKYKSITILLLGELFGPRMPLSFSYTSKIIHNISTRKQISLSGNDLQPLFSIYEEDAMEGIHSCLFGLTKRNTIFFLFYSHPHSLLSATHLLRRIEPELVVNLEGGKTEYQTVYPTLESFNQELRSNLGIVPEYLRTQYLGFEKGIEKTLASFSSSPKTPSDYQKTTKKKLKIPHVPFILSICIGALILFFSVQVLALFAGMVFIHHGISSFKQNNFTQAEEHIKNSNLFLTLSEPIIVMFSALPRASGETHSPISQIREARVIVKQLSESLLVFKTLEKNISSSSFERFSAEMLSLFFRLQEARGKEYKNVLEHPFARSINIFPIASQILGINREKHYLILFQNNRELRPTGGFIGSVGELTLSSGKITNFTIQDVYELDGQLKAHVEPYYIVRRYLQPHLYLRDSNFDIDFEKSASTAALLYNLETGKKVDGVVGVDFEVLKKIVALTGPITLFDYNKTLDANSLFEFIQDTIESNKFPGSRQKKDILDSVFKQVTLKLEEDKNLLYRILGELPSLLEEKHIQIVLQDPTLQPLLSINKFSNSLQWKDLTNEITLGNILGINEANIGVNKVNQHISRELEYTVFLNRQGFVESHVEISFSNSSPKDDYKSYIRVMTPKGTVLDKIHIDGVEQPIIPAITDYRAFEEKSFQPPPGLEVDTISQADVNIFGFITIVPKNVTRKIEITYRKNYTLRNAFEYALSYIKQAGTAPYPLTLRIHPPVGYRLENIPEGTSGEVIEFRKQISTDIKYSARFLKRQ